MDRQDDLTNHPEGHESRGAHLCHKCGWPFPNPHPSAKLSRAHRKLCGTIEGYKLVGSEETSHCALSDDDHFDHTPTFSIPLRDSSRSSQIQNAEVQHFKLLEKADESENHGFRPLVTDQPVIQPGAAKRDSASNTDQIKLDAHIGISQEQQENDADVYLTNIGTERNRKTDFDKTPLDLLKPPNDKGGEVSEKLPEAGGEVVLFGEEGPNDVSVGKAGTLIGLPTEYACIENIDADVSPAKIKLDIDQVMESDAAQISTKNHEEKNAHNDNLHLLSLRGDVPIVDNADVMVHGFKDCKGEKLLPILNAHYIELSSDGKLFNHEGDSDLSAIDMSHSEDHQEKDETTKMIVGRLPKESEAVVLQVKSTENQRERFEESEASNDLIPIEVDKSSIVPTADEQPLHSNALLTRYSPEPGATLSLVDSTSALMDSGVKETALMDSGVKETINLAAVYDATSAKEAVTEAINNEINRTTQDKPVKENSEAFRADSMTLELQNFSKINLSTGQNTADHEHTKSDRFDDSQTESRNTVIASGSKENQSMKKEGPMEDEIEQKSSIFTSDISPVPEIETVESENGQLGRIVGTQQSVMEVESCRKEEVERECAGKVCAATEFLNEDVKVLERALEDRIKEHLVSTPETSLNDENSVNVEQKNCSTRTGGGSLVQSLPGESNKSATQCVGISTADLSGDSSSQTDSLEGHWGSVSVLSGQSDVPIATGAEPGPSKASDALTKVEKFSSENSKATPLVHIDNSDMCFEPPSFMTWVEPKTRGNREAAGDEIQTMENQGNTAAASLQTSWFPSITNVVKESKARKKNEKIIEKVSGWSTGKPHTPLKSLLGEANAGAKSKSRNLMEDPVPVDQERENTTKDEGSLGLKVGSIPISVVQVAKPANKAGKDWSSRARFPQDTKKDKTKVKGRACWAPFVCCSSVN